MYRFVVLLLILFLSAHANAQYGTPACPYYAVNSSNNYSCFKTLAAAEAFIRTDTGGTHASRKYLEQSSAEPNSGAYVRLNYLVKPRPGIEGEQAFQASHMKSSASTSYLACGCDVTGSSAKCIPYGPVSNCTNQPALCQYGNYCTARSLIYEAMEDLEKTYNCRNTANAASITSPPSSPLGFSSSVPDQRPIYPPNTGTLKYYGYNNNVFVGEIVQLQWEGCGQTGTSNREMHIATPLTCPSGYTINPGSPLKKSEACRSNESGYIIVYRAPICPVSNPDDVPGCGLYGNPVVAATGAKLQSPQGWSSESMLGLSLAYNSLNSDSVYGSLGGGWTSLLSARILGGNYSRTVYAYLDPAGNIEIFNQLSDGTFRSRNSSQKFMRFTSTSPCQVTVFEPDRRMVFNCAGTDWRLVRVEYPDLPQNNLSIDWSTSEAFDSNGIQTEFNNVPTMLNRADGRRLNLVYARVNNAIDCDSAIAAYGCNAVRLTAISDSNGDITLFDYNLAGHLSLISYPDGSRERYEYAAPNDICPSSMPGACDKTPDLSLAQLLLTGTYIETSRADGTYDSIRYGIYQFDNYNRAIVTTHPGDAERTEFRYATNDVPTVRMSINGSSYRNHTITSQRVSLYDKPKTISETDPSGANIRTRTNAYGSDGYLSQSTDFRGVRTDWKFNDAGLQIQKVVAANDVTGKRSTTQTDWNMMFRVPAERRLYDSSAAVPGVLVSRTVWIYNSRGQTTALCQIDPGNAVAMAYICGSTTNAPMGVSQTLTSYCEQTDIDTSVCPLLGLVISVDGPRVDVTDSTTYIYYHSDDAGCTSVPPACLHRKADLWKLINASGEVTEYLRYDGASRVLSLKDANGIITDLEYSSRGWLTARKIRGADNNSEVDDAITRFEYDSSGQVTKATQPDGVFSVLGYDSAHRLIDINDALGNNVHYTLDNAGNRIKEDTIDASDTLKRTLLRLYNNLDLLQASVDAFSEPTDYTYDLNGNVDKVTDALGRVTDNDFDPLNRLKQVIANTAGAVGDRAMTQFQYDARDNLTTVIDPKGLATSYIYNGLNDLTQLVSPDTGTTSYTYDAAGNRLSQLDARGITTYYAYDAVNRLISQTLPTPAENVYFDYDVPQVDCLAGETFNAGRLAQMRDESGSTRYCYDHLGNLVRKVQTVVGGTVLTQGATFNAAGRPIAITYPSGAVVTYLRNTNGQITRVDTQSTATAAQVTLIGSTAYLPFGPLERLTFGNGRELRKAYDANYGIDAITDSDMVGLSEDFTLDAIGNLAGLAERISDTVVANREFSYDGLNRLTTHSDHQGAIESFVYDATGNRLNMTSTGSTAAYSYAVDSHRLVAVGSATRKYDANGNTVEMVDTVDNRKLFFNDRSRLYELHRNGILLTNYRYNGKGERVLKSDIMTVANSRQFVYDETGHLLGEYTLAGERVKEYVWLDDMLIAILSDFDGSSYQYVETDHLGTPRAVVHPGKNEIVWRWNLSNATFGEHLPNENPDGDAFSYFMNLRYPGQYYDVESKLAYNRNRYYDFATNRYNESDPLGLRGGLNTYRYAYANPLLYSDPSGLSPECRVVAVIPGLTRESRTSSTLMSSDAYFNWIRIVPNYANIPRWLKLPISGPVIQMGFYADCAATVVKRYQDTYDRWRENTVIQVCAENTCDGSNFSIHINSERESLGQRQKYRIEKDGGYRQVYPVDSGLEGEMKCRDWIQGLK